MDRVEFTVEGVEGEFTCDADEMRSYKTIKQLALGDEDLGGMFRAMERIYMGHDEEYVERVGGFERAGRLNSAATEAVRAKNSSGSSRASKGTGARR